MNSALAARIGIIGLLFTKLEHQHIFTIVYKDEFDDRKVAILDFDNKEYVLPIKAALSEVSEVNWFFRIQILVYKKQFFLFIKR